MQKNKELLRDIKLEQECFRLTEINARLLDFVYLSAASKRIGGEYSNSREDLQNKARKVLDIIDL